MTDVTLLGSWVRRFLLEHLVGERNLARNTQRSYRDTLRLLLPFISRLAGKPVDRLAVEDLSAERVRLFLSRLEEERSWSAATRNQRLAAIHALAQFIGLLSPEYISWWGTVRAVPFKKAPRPLVSYLDKPEMDAVLAAPDPATAQGRRDRTLLLFLYNTGARADEVAHVQVGDLQLTFTPDRDPSWALLRGKGNKLRRCPLWERTVSVLRPLVQDRAAGEAVFLNRCGRPLTRFGIHALVERYAAQVAATMPSLATKQVSPHTIRHTTATHLLRAGVDINTIRAWLGHASLCTTNVYAEVDLEMKAKALAACEIQEEAPESRQEARGLMDFLGSL